MIIWKELLCRFCGNCDNIPHYQEKCKICGGDL